MRIEEALSVSTRLNGMGHGRTKTPPVRTSVITRISHPGSTTMGMPTTRVPSDTSMVVRRDSALSSSGMTKYCTASGAIAAMMMQDERQVDRHARIQMLLLLEDERALWIHGDYRPFCLATVSMARSRRSGDWLPMSMLLPLSYSISTPRSPRAFHARLPVPSLMR